MSELVSGQIMTDIIIILSWTAPPALALVIFIIYKKIKRKREKEIKESEESNENMDD